MNTQTKPELKEPKHPGGVALDTEDSSRIDVCTTPNSNHPEWVSVYIRHPSVNMNGFLRKVTGLETRFLPYSATELRERFLGLMLEETPLMDEDRGNGVYAMRYHESVKDRVYDAVRRI